MTLVDSTPRALESIVPSAPDVSEYMPAGRRMTIAAGEVPSARRLMRDLKIGEPKASEIKRKLIEENPLSPVSSGAPPYPASVEVTGAYRLIPPTLPAGPAPEAPRHRTWPRTAALIVPLLLVNSAAIYGQQGWAFDHLGGDRIIALLFALAVESIGVYLAAEAHAALMAGDASARLRVGSYLVGILVGSLNYAHFAGAGYDPNPLAATFGLLSAISPMLWSIRSRSLNRDKLRELGLVDPRAVRFSLLRWALFPIRTGRAFRGAVWAGIVQPSEAVANADAVRAGKTASKATTDVPAPEPA